MAFVVAVRRSRATARTSRVGVSGVGSCRRVRAGGSVLDIHHKDGDHLNDDPDNLETLCANCHRLEHVKNGGHTDVARRT